MAKKTGKLVDIKTNPSTASIEGFIHKLADVYLKVLEGTINASANR